MKLKEEFLYAAQWSGQVLPLPRYAKHTRRLRVSRRLGELASVDKSRAGALLIYEIEWETMYSAGTQVGLGAINSSEKI